MYKRFVSMAVGLGAAVGIIISTLNIGSSASAAPCPTVRYGATGACVTQLQTRLGQLGYMPSTSATGGFFSVTDRAVREFQQDTGIGVDGIVGPQTWGKLQTTTLASLSPYGIPPVCLHRPMIVCISKSTHKLYLLQNGAITMTLDARFGDARGPAFATAEGTYAITRKVEREVSYQYENAPMPFTNYFYGGQGIHYSYDFAAGDTRDDSHGCVRLRDWHGAATLFNNVPTGTPVFIFRTT